MATAVESSKASSTDQDVEKHQVKMTDEEREQHRVDNPHLYDADGLRVDGDDEDHLHEPPVGFQPSYSGSNCPKNERINL